MRRAYRRARRIEHPAARAAATVASLALAPLALAWYAFWVPTTLPIHGVMRAAGHRGFLSKDGESYRVPPWAMVLIAAVCAAPHVL